MGALKVFSAQESGFKSSLPYGDLQAGVCSGPTRGTCPTTHAKDMWLTWQGPASGGGRTQFLPDPSILPIRVAAAEALGLWLERHHSEPSEVPAFHGQGKGPLPVDACLPVLSRVYLQLLTQSALTVLLVTQPACRLGFSLWRKLSVLFLLSFPQMTLGAS